MMGVFCWRARALGPSEFCYWECFVGAVHTPNEAGTTFFQQTVVGQPIV